MEIRVVRAADVSPARRREIEQAVADAFGDDDEGLVWDTQRDWHVMVEEQGQLVSFLGIRERDCTAAGRPVHVGGVADVVTLPPWRGRGYAAAALRCAASFMGNDLGVDLCLLVCKEHLVPFYARLGWQRAPGPLAIDQPSGKVTYAEATMVLPCRGEAVPEGTIDLCGLPL
jgi:GNAT superfamily N-acetyltransferase